MQGTPKRAVLCEMNREGRVHELNREGRGLGNSPRGLATSMEGGLDNIALLNIGTPPGKKKEEKEKEVK